MASIESLKLAVGYLSPAERFTCRNCVHGTEVFAQDATSREWPHWECARYGFRIAPTAICKRYEPKVQTGGAACDEGGG